MKYKCEMVKDLMPLCLDNEASKSSEETVIKHLAECRECTEYYDTLRKELTPMTEETQTNKYVLLAAKLRKRRLIYAFLIGLTTWVLCFLCLNYAMNYAKGYRSTSKAAADLSGHLYEQSKLLTSYDWQEEYHFYIYDNLSCYDIIGAKRTPLGWIKDENILNWPKWSFYDNTVGVECAGALYHFVHDEGVQLFPVVVYDEAIQRIEVTCFGQTQTKDVVSGEITLFTFDAVYEHSNDIEALAYDGTGAVLYRFNNRQFPAKWEKE